MSRLVVTKDLTDEEIDSIGMKVRNNLPRGWFDANAIGMEIKLGRRAFFDTHCGRKLLKVYLYRNIDDGKCRTHKNFRRTYLGHYWLCPCEDCEYVEFYLRDIYCY